MDGHDFQRACIKSLLKAPHPKSTMVSSCTSSGAWDAGWILNVLAHGYAQREAIPLFVQQDCRSMCPRQEPMSSSH